MGVAGQTIEIAEWNQQPELQVELEVGLATGPWANIDSYSLPDPRACTTVAAMAGPRPEDLLDQLVPDVSLPGSDGQILRFRGRQGVGPLVLFFYLRNASPG